MIKMPIFETHFFSYKATKKKKFYGRMGLPSRVGRFFCLFVCFALFCFVLFCFVLFCFVLLCCVLFCFILYYFYFTSGSKNDPKHMKISEEKKIVEKFVGKFWENIFNHFQKFSHFGQKKKKKPADFTRFWKN